MPPSSPGWWSWGATSSRPRGPATTLIHIHTRFVTTLRQGRGAEARPEAPARPVGQQARVRARRARAPARRVGLLGRVRAGRARTPAAPRMPPTAAGSKPVAVVERRRLRASGILPRLAWRFSSWPERRDGVGAGDVLAETESWVRGRGRGWEKTGSSDTNEPRDVVGCARGDDGQHDVRREPAGRRCGHGDAGGGLLGRPPARARL